MLISSLFSDLHLTMKSLITSLLISSAVAGPIFSGSVLDKRQQRGGGGGNTGIAALVGGFLNSKFETSLMRSGSLNL